MKKIRAIIILTLAFSCSIFGQNAEPDKVKAQEILAKAKTAISKKRKPEEIKSLSIASASIKKSVLSLRSGQLVMIDDTIKSEIHFEQQNLKIREKEVTEQTTTVNKNTDLSQVVEESVLNGDKFSYNRDTFVDNEKINVGVPILPKAQGITNLTYRLLPTVFAITLDSWYFPLDFYYAGIAEAKDERANIIEAISADKTTYRFFFDEKTNLLLLMTRTFSNSANQKTEQKYYYSDYREMDGLLVATKIKTEILQPNGKIIENREVKTVKINPTFKSNFF